MNSKESDSLSTSAALKESARYSLFRFSGVLLVAAIGTALVVRLGFLPNEVKEPPHWRLILTCILGISWLYSLSLIAERRLSRPMSLWLPLVVGFGTLGLYYFRLTQLDFDSLQASFVIEYASLFLALHFFAAYAPFLGFQEPRGFWEYNKAIFLRFLLALLFSLTLLIGSNLFFAALAQVLRFPYFDKVILILMGLILGIFNTWFFLAGVPRNFASLEAAPPPYPRALKFFVSFILVPLAIALTFVMELWLIKAMVTSQAIGSEQSVAFVGLGAFGLLTYLLLYPLRQESKQGWPRLFEKGFFIALLPLLGAVVYNALRLVRGFGWTEPRYYAVLLGFWGLALCLYFLFAKNRRLQWIPVSLSLLTLLGMAGPLGALGTTRRSQEARLDALMRRSGFVKGEVTAEKLSALPQGDRELILSQVSYLENYVDCQSLRSYFGTLVLSDRQKPEECSSQKLRNLLTRDPNLPPPSAGEPDPIALNFLLSSSMDREVSVQGFDRYFPAATIRVLDTGKPAADCPQPYEETPLCVTQSKANFEVELYLKGHSLGRLDLEPVIQSLMKKHFPENSDAGKATEETSQSANLSREELTFDLSNGAGKFRLGFDQIRVERRGPKVYPDYLRFSLLFKPGT